MTGRAPESAATRRDVSVPTLRHGRAVTLAAGLAGALLVVVAFPYDGRLLAPHFVPRLAPLYPLALALVAIGVVVVRPLARPLRIDLIDVLAIALALWLALTAWLSPTAWVAWMGYYNRGSGAAFWITALALFVAARRLVAGVLARSRLVWIVVAVLMGAGVVALAQRLGAHDLWGGDFGQGRVSGTTGSPLNLAGLCLAGVWLGATAVELRGRPATRLAAMSGAGAALVGLVLSVTRAAYLGAGAALVVLVVVWLILGSRRPAITAAVAIGVLAVCGLFYAPAGQADLTVAHRFVAGGFGSSLSGSDEKRVELWNEALRGLWSRPATGFGAGAFVVADRLFRPASLRVRDPWNVASDPHSLPLLLAVGTGVPGTVLAGALFAALVVALAVGVRRARGARETHVDHPARRKQLEGLGAPGGFVPALALVGGALVFLLVSPADPIVVVPAALLVGAGLGEPRAGGRAVWTIPALPPARGSRGALVTLAVWALPAVGAAGVVMAAAVGVQYYRADLAFSAAARNADPAPARRAARLFPWEPLYLLEAGAQTWHADQRQGRASPEGEALVRRGIDRDPTGAMGYADLARFEIGGGRFAAAADDLRPGLRWNTHNPILEGLWAFAAASAGRAGDKATADSLLGSLRSGGPISPDGWFWMSVAYRVLGERGEATAAMAAAKRLAPFLTTSLFERRLLGGR